MSKMKRRTDWKRQVRKEKAQPESKPDPKSDGRTADAAVIRFVRYTAGQRTEDYLKRWNKEAQRELKQRQLDDYLRGKYHDATPENREKSLTAASMTALELTEGLVTLGR